MNVSRRPFLARSFFRNLPILALWMVLPVLFLPSRPAHAADNDQHAFPCSVSSIAITVPDVTIANPGDVATGSLLGSPGTATATFNCPSSGYENPWQYYQRYNRYGRLETAKLQHYPYSYPNISIQSVINGNPTYDSTLGGLLYPTNLAGISLLLKTSPNQAQGDGDTLETINQGTTTASITFTAQLVKTGTLTPGTVSSPLQLMQFKNYTYGKTDSSAPYGSLTLNPINIGVSACSVTTDPTNVQLPDVMTSQFTGNDHPGETSFNVFLDCSRSAQVVVTLDSGNAVPGRPGVIAPTKVGNYAHGVGVQVLDGNGDTITFGTPLNPVHVNAGTSNIPFRARYYKIGNTAVTGGDVKATATYTLTYQ